jgi:hypothetical protein
MPHFLAGLTSAEMRALLARRFAEDPAYHTAGVDRLPTRLAETNIDEDSGGSP